jgi:peroxiredoxin Q/BCP
MFFCALRKLLTTTVQLAGYSTNKIDEIQPMICYTHSMLEQNDLAPHFSLPDQDGATHTLEEFRNQWLIVYFYPKDDTPGCTKEACSFRDRFEQLKQRGVALVGISKDTVESHKKFGEKYHLPFPLLSDETGEVIQEFDAWGTKKFMGREYKGILRMSFLINPSGQVVKIYKDVNPADHVQEILQDLEVYQELT